MNFHERAIEAYRKRREAEAKASLDHLMKTLTEGWGVPEDNLKVQEETGHIDVEGLVFRSEGGCIEVLPPSTERFGGVIEWHPVKDLADIGAVLHKRLQS